MAKLPEKASWVGLTSRIIIATTYFILALNPFWSLRTALAADWNATGSLVFLGIMLLIAVLTIFRVRSHNYPRWTYGVGGAFLLICLFFLFSSGVLNGVWWPGIILSGILTGLWSYGPNIFALYHHLDAKWKRQRTRKVNG